MSSGYHTIKDALLNKKTSRLPCFPLIDSAFAAAYFKKPMREVQLNPKLHADAICACAEELPVDGVYINLGLASGQAVQLTESTYRIDDSVTLVIPANDVLSSSKTDIKSLEDERFESADLFHPGILDTFRSMNEKVKENYAVALGLTGTFSQVAFLYGISEILMALLDQPDAVRETLARRHKIAVQQAEKSARPARDSFGSVKESGPEASSLRISIGSLSCLMSRTWLRKSVRRECSRSCISVVMSLPPYRILRDAELMDLIWTTQCTYKQPWTRSCPRLQ